MADILILTGALAIGILAGIITGLIPGLHTNTIAALIVASLSIILSFAAPLAVGVFLIAMVVVHSFVDFIPSIFLGAPEAETALTILPGHRMLMEGRGYDALKLTVIGGFGSFVIGLLLLPSFSFLVLNGYNLLTKFIVPIVLFITAFFILLEKTTVKKIWAVVIILLSGVLGIISLYNLSINEPLFPLLSGLFGISTLMISMKENITIPKQTINSRLNFGSWMNYKNYLKSVISSSIMSVLPALGAAQATILAQSFTKEKDHENFLVIVGGINTASALFVLTTLLLISRSRTGVIAALSQFLTLTTTDFIILIAVSIAAAFIGAHLTLDIGRVLANKISKINYRLFSIIVIVFLVGVTAIVSNLIGLLVLSISTAIGLIAPLAGVKRVHAMSVIAVPVVLNFI